jgi:hypothetical protein
MKRLALAVIPLLICGTTVPARAQAPGSAEAFMSQAKAAAGSDWSRIYRSLCESPASGPSAASLSNQPPGPAPERDKWLTEPVKIFDNLYFVGTKEHSSWAVVTSAGIILLDTLYEYASEDAIIGGLTKLGLDPAQIKYLIVSHGHGDHVGGAGLIQQRFNPRVIMGGPDWDSVEKSARIPNKPRRDVVASDGQKVTLGDTTVTVYLTPATPRARWDSCSRSGMAAERTPWRTGVARDSTFPNRSLHSRPTWSRPGASTNWPVRPVPMCCSPTTLRWTDRPPRCRSSRNAPPARPIPMWWGAMACHAICEWHRTAPA